ncbi:hypothetical protein [Actinoplanes philippinensis]|uniref:hypothetical protein n=1 Tax=Actinoplanes philippinensis TaxID=35752 RepID=UPI0011602ED4|nr:hypothetical protein [Actinoplanes philippinensis]
MSVVVAVVALLTAAGAWAGRLLNESDAGPAAPAPSASSDPSVPATTDPVPGTPAARVYTPAEICGAGRGAYRVVDSKKLKTSGGTVRGVAYLLYSDSDGSHCAVTMKEKGVGEEASVAVHPKGELGLVADDGGGDYAVMISGKDGACVQWNAWIGDVSYVSEKRHCG